MDICKAKQCDDYNENMLNNCGWRKNNNVDLKACSNEQLIHELYEQIDELQQSKQALTTERDLYKEEAGRYNNLWGGEIKEHTKSLVTQNLYREALRNVVWSTDSCGIVCGIGDVDCGSDECIELHLQQARGK